MRVSRNHLNSHSYKVCHGWPGSNAYVPVGALAGLAIGYFMFHDGRSTLAALFLAVIVGAVIGFFVAKGSNNRH